MPKIRELTQTPPMAEGDAEAQVDALRDYLLRITEELTYLLTHLEADNINDSTFERIAGMIPKAAITAPPMDGQGSAGSSSTWARGDHQHPKDRDKADVSALAAQAASLAAHVADQLNPHGVTAAQTGAIPATEKGIAGGVAELDGDGRVPTSQLPATALLALGETSGTAYRGDRGKTAYDHSQTAGNPHGTTAADVGARPDDWTPSASDVGAIPAAEKGAAGGVAELDSNGLVPAEQLPTAASPATDVPLVDGAGAVGTSIKYAREDHEHPHDDSKQDLVYLSVVDGKLCVTYEDGEE